MADKPTPPSSTNIPVVRHGGDAPARLVTLADAAKAVPAGWPSLAYLAGAIARSAAAKKK